MKMTYLLGLLLPAVRGATLTYPDDISAFDFSWWNPDVGRDRATGPSDATLMTDGDTTSGSGEVLSNPVSGSGVWGTLTSDTSVGMDGKFQATTLDLDTGNTYWSISSAEIVFETACFSEDTTATAFYYDRSTASEVTLTVTTTNAGNMYTFAADITTALETNGYIGFNITSNVACEGDIEILEFTLDGEQIATAAPTQIPTTTATPTIAPSPAPTATPTTDSPTDPPVSNDWRVGIQLHDGNANNVYKVGEIRYTPYFSEGSNEWSVWAGDNNYYDPDAFRIGIFAKDNGTSLDFFPLIDTDIRIGIQLTDVASDETGNENHEGEKRYTPWASEGGGWSVWSGDSNYYDFDAVRVVIETQDSPGLEISNIMLGAWLTDVSSDETGNANKAGDPVYTNWFGDEGNGGWSTWGGDNNFYDPDSIALYMGVVTNNGITNNVNAAFTSSSGSDESGGWSAGTIAAVVCLSLFIVVGGVLGLLWYRRQNKVIAGVELDDVEDDVINNLGKSVMVGDEDLLPIGMKSTNIGDMEQDIMIDVQVTETNQ